MKSGLKIIRGYVITCWMWLCSHAGELKSISLSVIGSCSDYSSHLYRNYSFWIVAVSYVQHVFHRCAPDLSCLKVKTGIVPIESVFYAFKGHSWEDFHALQVLSQQISLTAFQFYCPAGWICAAPSRPPPFPGCVNCLSPAGWGGCKLHRLC